ncbi:MAG: nucleoside-diphosphate sugar epimerase/dehydratase [Chloroflexota bacterium]
MELLGAFMSKLRNRHFLAMDAVAFLLTPLAALILRMDGTLPLDRYGRSLVVVTIVFLLVKMAVFFRGGLYSRFWRYAGLDELARIALVGVIALVIQTALFLLVLQPIGWVGRDFPRSVPVVEGILALLVAGAIRYSVPWAARRVQKRGPRSDAKRLLVAGAGSAGMMMVLEMQRNPDLGMWPVAFVDDALDKQNMNIKGVPVLGQCKDIARVAEVTGAQLVVIAMPTAPGKVIRDIVRRCEDVDIETKIMPGMYELLGGRVGIKQLRDVDIEDLLRREPIQTDIAALGDLLRGKRVLVTGGGGSIGSELCRQVLRFDPQSLVILGHGENSVFHVHRELLKLQEQVRARSQGGQNTVIDSVIADIRFPDRIQNIFEQYRPQVVFHSAAHKHVPLMEENPSEAITNNVLGTRILLDASELVGVDHFVMISTDKAVNPSSIMGATKRVAELLVHQAALRNGRPYVAVRFGNVLGSRGSVVETFKEQILAGGPVTVTHPQMMRYFMTIPEAVQLVLQAAALGKGGEIFMLDMGEPLRILDLAHDIIELSGLTVGHDIDVVFTGIRPGEKLSEELHLEGEEYEPTPHDKIRSVRQVADLLPQRLDRAVISLISAAQSDNRRRIMAGLRLLVPEFLQKGPGAEEIAPAPNGLHLEVAEPLIADATMTTSRTLHPPRQADETV